jgi:hypothetical protein
MKETSFDNEEKFNVNKFPSRKNVSMKSSVYFKGAFCPKLPSILKVKVPYLFMPTSVKYFYVAVSI